MARKLPSVEQMRGAPKYLIALFFVAVLSSGCLTRTLWQAESRHAAADPNLALAAAPDNSDVLVQYDERQDGKIRRRSYWLFEYTTVKGGTGKPHFVRPRTYTNMALVPIPISSETLIDGTEPMVGFAALLTSELESFDLQRQGIPLGRFYLPTYSVDAKPTFGRIVATPFTVVLDGVGFVGAGLGAGAAEYVGSGDWIGDAIDAATSDSDDGNDGGMRATRKP